MSPDRCTHCGAPIPECSRCIAQSEAHIGHSLGIVKGGSHPAAPVVSNGRSLNTATEPLVIICDKIRRLRRKTAVSLMLNARRTLLSYDHRRDVLNVSRRFLVSPPDILRAGVVAMLSRNAQEMQMQREKVTAHFLEQDIAEEDNS